MTKQTKIAIKASSRSIFFVVGVAFLSLGVGVGIYTIRNKNTEGEIKSIYGQVSYDHSEQLSAPSLLIIQVIESSNHDCSKKIIAKLTKNTEEKTTIDFILPVNSITLDKEHIYTIQAKIISKDTYWLVNERFTLIEPKRTDYHINLIRVGVNKQVLSTKNPLLGREWLVENFLGSNFIENHAQMATLFIQDKDNVTKTHGFTGCNYYNATTTIDDAKNTLSFGTLITTFIACPDTFSLQESYFKTMMSQVRSYIPDQKGLFYLLDEEQDVIARLSPI